MAQGGSHDHRLLGEGGNKKSTSTFRRSGRITILFAWYIVFFLAISDSPGQRTSSSAAAAAAITTISRWPYKGRNGRGEDVQVFFGNGRDGIRSQSISFADPNGGSERFPRQLDTVHDHLMWRSDGDAWHKREGEKDWPETARTFDSEYERFINEHFRQNSQPEYRPESESEQMARDHERFRQLPHYQRNSHPAEAPSRQVEQGIGWRPNKFKIELRPPPTIQEDVEDYQPNDEAVTKKGQLDDYQRIKQLSEQQQGDENNKQRRECKAIRKGDMMCQLCLNPRTGAKSESCAYASKPHAKKYAYTKANKYSTSGGDDSDDSNESDDDKDSRDTEEDEDDPEIHASLQPLRKRSQSKTSRSRPRTKREEGRVRAGRWRKRRMRTDLDGLTVVVATEDDGGELLSSRRFPESQKYSGKDLDYGNGAHGETREKNQREGEDYELVGRQTGEEGATLTKNVERALADFRKRNWSDCKKTKKHELTCYECEDERGGRHEECMFASDSSVDDDPHLTYVLADDETYNWAKNNNRTSASGGQTEARAEGGVVGVKGAASESGQTNATELGELLPRDVQDDDKWRDRRNNRPDSEDGLEGSGSGDGDDVDRNKKNIVKLNRKLVIKKRKLKQQESDYIREDDGPSSSTVGVVVVPETIQPLSAGKRTIRKKVTYRKAAKHQRNLQGKGEKPEDSDPPSQGYNPTTNKK